MSGLPADAAILAGWPRQAMAGHREAALQTGPGWLLPAKGPLTVS